MNKNGKIILNRILASLLSVSMIGVAVVPTNTLVVKAENLPENITVSYNSTDNSADDLLDAIGANLNDDETLDIIDDDADAEEKDNIMLYQGISLEEAAALREKHAKENGEAVQSNVLDTEATSYLTESVWDNTSMQRGSQSDGQAYFNLLLNNVWSSSYGVEYVFEGKVYYFNNLSNYVGSIKAANAAGVPVNVELLMQVEADANKFKLYDEYALANIVGKPKTNPYIAPNISGTESRYYRAELAYLAELFSRNDCHIDNWIVGNEVNMPNSWYYTGSADVTHNTELYAWEYLGVYNAVRKYTNKSRVSFCFDHSWQHNDEGRGISVKDYLTHLVASINSKQGNVDWTISYHMYPSYLPEAAIWTGTPFEAIYGRELNPRDGGAEFVDGYNLFVLTDFVRDTFGSSHKIMCTEQGFSQYMGEDVQAASLALSYYAAKYDPMVESFIIHEANEGGNQNFSLSAKARSVWQNLDSNPGYVESVVLPIIGIGSFAEVVPNYGKQTLKPNRTKIKAFVTRIYQLGLDREPETEGLEYWTDVLAAGKMSGAEVAGYFFFSKEMTSKNLSDAEFLERMYKVMMDRSSDPEGAAYWCAVMSDGYGRKGVLKGFCASKEYTAICANYGIVRGDYPATGSGRSRGLSSFVSRLYTKALGRTYDQEGLDYWCEVIYNKKLSINNVASTQFFHSKEFLSKNLNDRQYLEVLYRTFMGREYDEEGMQYWLGKLNGGGMTRDQVLDCFVDSKEFTKIKAGFGL